MDRIGEHEKASYIGLSLVQQFPRKLGILLLTAECLINYKEFQTASRLLRNSLSALPDQADLWLTLARVEALLGQNEAARDCVRQYVTLNPEAKADVLTIAELAEIW
jgi:predicted Zn-dependent protease